MTVSAITHNIVSSMITIKPATLALTALAVYVISNIPMASAGSATYKSCMAGCAALPPGGFQVACWAACLTTLGPWCP